MTIKTYKKEYDYTYTLGVFETIEALKSKPQHILKVYIKKESYQNKGLDIITKLCKDNNIEIIESDNTVNKLAKKNNCFAIALIEKYQASLENEKHIVLVNPGDMGNIGTIIRTMLGYNYKNLAIIKPGVDVFDPKVLRSSMGAIFNINIEYYDSFNDYLTKFKDRDIFTLMLKGATNIHHLKCNNNLHSLVFGNESSGLSDEYLGYGKSIFIPHSNNIDSLNLSIAIGITLAHFSINEFKDINIFK